MAGDSKYSCAGDNAIHRREQRRQERINQRKEKNMEWNRAVEMCAQRLYAYMIETGLRGWANDATAVIREMKDK